MAPPGQRRRKAKAPKGARRLPATAAPGQSDESYRQLVDRAADIIFRTDADGHYTFIGAAVTSILGYSPEELRGWHFLDLIQPELRDDVRMFYAWQFSELNPLTYFEFPAVAKDGHLVWIGQTTRLVREGDRVVAFEAVARDISDRHRAEAALRESEDRFRTAFEDAPIGMAMTSLDGRFLRSNRAFCEMLGYSQAELIEKRFADITHPEDREDSLLAAGRLISGEIRLYDVEQRYLHKDARAVWAVLRVSLVRTENGEPLHFVAQMFDITERKHAEEDRERLLEDLTRALANVKTLSGLLPICASCKKIRDDQGYWNRIEDYIRRHSEAQLTHGVCPDCVQKLYPDLKDKI